MPKTAKDSRPRIWTEGSQNPPFDARAFARASVVCAREGLSGLLGRCSASAAGFGAEVATGRWRVPPDRLGRSGRFLPSVARTAAAIRGGAEVLARAGRSVGRDRAQEPAPPTIFAAEPAAPRPARPAPTAVGPEEDGDLAAIRALLREPAALAAPAPRKTAAPEEAPPAFTRGRDRLAAGAGWLLGHALLVLALPVGAALAGIAHLNGEDLRRRAEG